MRKRKEHMKEQPTQEEVSKYLNEDLLECLMDLEDIFIDLMNMETEYLEKLDLEEGCKK